MKTALHYLSDEKGFYHNSLWDLHKTVRQLVFIINNFLKMPQQQITFFAKGKARDMFC